LVLLINTVIAVRYTLSLHDALPIYLHWQALARKWDCALWGSSYHVQNEKIDTSPGASELWFDPRRGSEKTFLKAITDFAAKSGRSEEHTSELQSRGHLVCRLLLEKK